MPTAQPSDISMELEDLSMTAMDAFCQDIAGMFDVAMNCQQQNICTETARNLKKIYKNISAVISAQAKGHLKGTFHVIFDREGLFTLAGVIVMQPKLKIVENRTKGAAAEAEDVRDAMKEGGNLLVGTWNRVCLEKWGKDSHLLQTNTFIGNPWNDTRASLNTAENEEFLYVPCEMTVADYPAFKCGVIFPKEIQNALSGNDSAAAETAREEKKQETPAAPKPAVEEKKTALPETKPAAAETKTESAGQKAEPAETKAAPVPQKTAEVKDQPAPEVKADAKSRTESTPAASPAVVESKPVARAIETLVAQAADSIKETTIPSAAAQFTSKDMDLLWTVCAKDIMRKSVIWCESDESVEQVRIKMDQNDVNYILVGTAGVVEGIVSRSDLKAIISPYLRPVFAQWRRPLDEASLQIKVKWAMTRPVHIVRPDKPLAIVMENMCRFGVRALPVVDQQGKVQGLITVFDIFRTLIQKNEDHLMISKTA